MRAVKATTGVHAVPLPSVGQRLLRSIHRGERRGKEPLSPLLPPASSAEVTLQRGKNQTKPKPKQKSCSPVFFPPFLSASSGLFCPEPLDCETACRVAGCLLAALLTSPYLREMKEGFSPG